MTEQITRRKFFFYGALLTGMIPMGGFGKNPSLRRLGYKSPNEKLNIAAIGAGGRAEVTLPEFESENIVAFADPDSERASNMFRWYEKVPRYADFRKMLEKEGKNIDAVVVTTPDHTHAVAALWCMERGKHVYLEKPLAHSIYETRLLTEAAARYKVATQMGNQGYSSEGSRIAAEIIWSGEIGDVTEVHAWTDRPIWPQGITALPPEERVPDTLNWDIWLGPATVRPFSSAYVPFNWRGWVDFGTGALGDGACHSMGAANMALRLGAPTNVEVIKRDGKIHYTYPKSSVTRFDFPARDSMPPVKIYWYEGVKELPYRPEGIPSGEPLIGGRGSFGSGGLVDLGRGKVVEPPQKSLGGLSAAEGNGSIFVGEKGFLTADGYGTNVRLLPESRQKAYKLPPQSLTRSPGHCADWIRACKGGTAACSNFSVAGPFTEWTLLGIVALHFEGKLEWDSASMRFTNIAEANEHIRPKFRKGWQIA